MGSGKQPGSGRRQPTFLISIWMLLICLSASAAGNRLIGINYGRVADNLPSPTQAVALIQQLKFGRVKIYDADPQVLTAMANTGLQVVVMVTNQELEGVGSSQATANEWVQKNVVAWHPAVNIITVVVGNEVLSDLTIQQTWPRLVPAMKNIHHALKRYKLRHVKVTTSVAIDCLETSYPPSNGTFRQDIAAPVIAPLLQFLSKTKFPFFINVYPYFAWASNPQQISLDYTLFGSRTVMVEDGSRHYSSLLDAQLDALFSAMEKLGFDKVKLGISETGWPTKGDTDEIGATIANAALYNSGLIKWGLGAKKGTPLRPGRDIPTFVFSLFNENLKPGPSTERNWGLLYPNGTSVYAIDLTGDLKDFEYAPLAQPLPFEPGLPGSSGNEDQTPLASPSSHKTQWCVAKPAVETEAMKSALEYACSQSDCEAIQKEQACYYPVSLRSHASYAFNSYYQRYKHDGGTCDFAGTAVLVSTNPSYKDCLYPA
ncbi:hypothetical protein O6H91_03G019800 [Diphasiastrum complanatum]|uniref:Uncharacterized protein n=2 Tax=Diphasiastrum complanatum TaxID=34168 RepID=A0ACC2E410_DIPCM|nr:hypothetical protein O6H91_03G019800 [Diphasiastrum complanatum]KAJ7561229.1 hypothetical protein O6H91_03G019800 [Diphasiastrum complanatum]